MKKNIAPKIYQHLFKQIGYTSIDGPSFIRPKSPIYKNLSGLDSVSALHRYYTDQGKEKITVRVVHKLDMEKPQHVVWFNDPGNDDLIEPHLVDKWELVLIE